MSRGSSVNAMNLLIYSPFLWNIFSLAEALEFCWSSFAKENKTNAIIDQEKHKIEQIYIWSAMNIRTGYIM